jgi:predicted nucleic acid-binding protein
MNCLVDTNVLSELAKPQPAGEVMVTPLENGRTA